MRERESFMKVKMHKDKAEIAGADNSEERVKIRAITIHQPATIVDKLYDFFDIFIEQTQRVWIGKHHSSDRIITRSFERLEIDIAATVRRNSHYGHAQHTNRCRIRSMCSIWDEHFRALLIAA